MLYVEDLKEYGYDLNKIIYFCERALLGLRGYDNKTEKVVVENLLSNLIEDCELELDN